MDVTSTNNFYKNNHEIIKNKEKEFFLFFGLFRAAPMAHGGSQARGLIGAIAAGLCHSHSSAGSKPYLQPTPQLMAMPDP